MAGLTESDDGLPFSGIAGLGRERGITGGLLLEGRELLAIEERRRVGGARNLGALAEFTPGGVTAGRSEDERLREFLAGEGAGHISADLGGLTLDVPDSVFGKSTLRATRRRRPANGQARQVVRLGRL